MNYPEEFLTYRLLSPKSFIHVINGIQAVTGIQDFNTKNEIQGNLNR